MVHAASSTKTAALLIPVSLLRDDIVPATGRTKAKSPGCSGFHASSYYDSCRKKSRCRGIAFGLCSFLAMARVSGRGCRRPTILGTPSGPKTSVTSRPKAKGRFEMILPWLPTGVP